MPERERPEGQSPQEHEPAPYAKASRFSTARRAGHVYERLQDAIYTGPPSDLSVYRILLNRVSHVAVLGQPPPEVLERRITRLLRQGEPVTLPPDVMATLFQRRAESIQEGQWIERHHRPGERL